MSPASYRTAPPRVDLLDYTDHTGAIQIGGGMCPNDRRITPYLLHPFGRLRKPCTSDCSTDPRRLREVGGGYAHSQGTTPEGSMTRRCEAS